MRRCACILYELCVHVPLLYVRARACRYVRLIRRPLRTEPVWGCMHYNGCWQPCAVCLAVEGKHWEGKLAEEGGGTARSGSLTCTLMSWRHRDAQQAHTLPPGFMAGRQKQGDAASLMLKSDGVVKHRLRTQHSGQNKTHKEVRQRTSRLCSPTLHLMSARALMKPNDVVNHDTAPFVRI